MVRRGVVSTPYRHQLLHQLHTQLQPGLARQQLLHVSVLHHPQHHHAGLALKTHNTHVEGVLHPTRVNVDIQWGLKRTLVLTC